MLLYRIFLLLYTSAIRITSLFNPKARLWIAGRRNILQKIQSALPHQEKRIWMHCASLGEFEQGRPILEAMKRDHPGYKIVLTFFSPSGYEVRKDAACADYVFYLPMDGKRNATAFLTAVNPSLVLFVKYEFWYFYLTEIKRRAIPSFLVSAAFRKDQAFFKWYGGFFRRMLHSFTHILVQDEGSKQLLAQIGMTDNVAVAGDTRYDRVLEIAANAKELPQIARFKENNKVLIGGSTWPKDEAILNALLPSLPADWKMIIAPHEIDRAHIAGIKALFGEGCVLYSEIGNQTSILQRVLVIDNIGMLSSLYRYGEIAFVGGGFNKSGIHNVLEPAVFGLPMLIGPEYKKFVEAVVLVELDFVTPISTQAAAISRIKELQADDHSYTALKNELKKYIILQSGATEKISSLILPYL